MSAVLLIKTVCTKGKPSEVDEFPLPKGIKTLPHIQVLAPSYHIRDLATLARGMRTVVNNHAKTRTLYWTVEATESFDRQLSKDLLHFRGTH
jgi:hypothetical protein